tara:strand:- start:7004 stop:7456 length:453 start_codon:yes stop_codon:yes gene_type:complete
MIWNNFQNMNSNKSIIIKNISRDQDKRGGILSIVDDYVKNVSIISCNPGSIRSNHYHLSDFHYMHVLDGEIDYFFKQIDSDDIQYLKVRKGENIFTPAKEIHATYFPIKTTLIVSSLNPRDQETYEKDTVRVEFVNEQNISELLKTYSNI